MSFLTRPVLTIDIVNFSMLDSARQINAVKKLIELLELAIPPDENHPTRRLWSPGGDGGSVTFLESIQAAVDTAIALSKLINTYNKNLPETERLLLHMGLHSGPVTREVDFDGRENIWGDGMNMSNRVASQAKANQILLSKEFYDQAELHSWREGEVTNIGRWWVKHARSFELYNLHKPSEGIGIPVEEVDVWYGPFQYPINHAVQLYESMLVEQAKTGPAFRVAALAKRIMDLDPKNELARDYLELISERRTKPTTIHLHDPFFSPLSSAALRYFFQHARFHPYPKGKVVVSENDFAYDMMVVVTGEVKLDKSEIVFREGDIIGEMGLFSPGGRRTATLVATKNTVTLKLDYERLKLDPAGMAAQRTVSPQELTKYEIRNQIWKSYCQRIVENQINSHRLFKNLTPPHRNDLVDQSIFLPKEHGQVVAVTTDDVWRNWTIVVSGTVTILDTHGKSLEYNRSDCFGPIRLVEDNCPFTEIKLSPDAQLVRIPWGSVKALVKEAQTAGNTGTYNFIADWSAAAAQERMKWFGLK